MAERLFRGRVRTLNQRTRVDGKVYSVYGVEPDQWKTKTGWKDGRGGFGGKTVTMLGPNGLVHKEVEGAIPLTASGRVNHETLARHRKTLK